MAVRRLLAGLEGGEWRGFAAAGLVVPVAVICLWQCGAAGLVWQSGRCVFRFSLTIPKSAVKPYLQIRLEPVLGSL